MNTHFFSFDENGVEFFDCPYKLLKATPRTEDCYVYVGDLDESNYDDSADDYRETNVLEWLKKEQLAVNSQVQNLLVGIGMAEKLSLEYNNNLLENVQLKETLAVAIASRLSTWFPDELMEDVDFAEDADMTKLNGEQLVKMIDRYAGFVRKGD